MSQSTSESANANRLLWAGFMSILAAGVGFAIRGGILDNWSREFNFTGAELGEIGGGGLTGFCFGIIIGGVLADKIGYGKLIVAAFAFHILSAVTTLYPSVGMESASVYQYLFWGTFMFAVANGLLEAAANPLVATLFPEKRTHYLNLLHASWPAGLIIGAAAGWILDDRLEWSWKPQLALFIIPTIAYGLMFLGQAMPKSAASKSGLSLAEMFKDVGILGSLIVCYFLSLFFADLFVPLLTTDGATTEQIAAAGQQASMIGYGIAGVLLITVAVITQFSLGAWLLFVLFIAHALVGAVELGTDNWIQNITGNILSSQQGRFLFIWTSTLMFLLRFCSDWIERTLKLSPPGILLVCSILACLGLYLASGVTTFTGALLALTVYAVGKTFFWPTMLAVASDRFPKTGAVAISIMGGIGLLSAGLVGSKGLGYAKDRFAGEALQQASAEVYEEYKAAKPSEFTFAKPSFGIDGQKLGMIQEKLSAISQDVTAAPLTDTEKMVHLASIDGDRKTLRADAFIPAMMAVIYLLIVLYFKSIGGYRRVELDGSDGGG